MKVRTFIEVLVIATVVFLIDMVLVYDVLVLEETATPMITIIIILIHTAFGTGAVYLLLSTIKMALTKEDKTDG